MGVIKRGVAGFGPDLARFGRIGSGFGRIWPDLVRILLHFAVFYRIGPHLTVLGRI